MFLGEEEEGELGGCFWITTNRLVSPWANALNPASLNIGSLITACSQLHRVTIRQWKLPSIAS